MKKILFIILPTLSLSALFGCAFKGASSIKDAIIGIGVFVNDYGNAIKFKNDDTYEYTYVNPQGEDASKTGGFRYSSTETCNWDGDWGYKGETTCHIFVLDEFAVKEEMRKDAYFVVKNESYYLYNTENYPTETELRSGLLGTQFHPIVNRGQ